MSPALKGLINNDANIKIGVDIRANSFIYTVPLAPDAKSGALPEIVYAFNSVEVPAVQLSPRSAAALTAPPAKGGKVDPAAAALQAAAQAAAAVPQAPVGSKTATELITNYTELWRSYGFLSIEEPFHSGDISGLRSFKQVCIILISNDLA